MGTWVILLKEVRNAIRRVTRILLKCVDISEAWIPPLPVNVIDDYVQQNTASKY